MQNQERYRDPKTGQWLRKDGTTRKPRVLPLREVTMSKPEEVLPHKQHYHQDPVNNRWLAYEDTIPVMHVSVITGEGVTEGTLNSDDTITTFPYTKDCYWTAKICPQSGRIPIGMQCILCLTQLTNAQELPVTLQAVYTKDTSIFVDVGYVCMGCAEDEDTIEAKLLLTSLLPHTEDIILPDTDTWQAASMAQQSYEKRVRSGTEPGWEHNAIRQDTGRQEEPRSDSGHHAE